MCRNKNKDEYKINVSDHYFSSIDLQSFVIRQNIFFNINWYTSILISDIWTGKN
jgi:hypothetical protein